MSTVPEATQVPVSTWVKAIPLILKIVSVLGVALATKNWNVVQEQGGFDTLMQLLAVFGVATAAVGSFATGEVMEKKQKKKEVERALGMEPPPKESKSGDTSTISLSAGGVTLRLTMLKSATPEHREQIVKAVESAIKVGGAP